MSNRWSFIRRIACHNLNRQFFKLFQYRGECLAVVFVTGVYAVTEDDAARVACRLDVVRKYVLVLTLSGSLTLTLT